jgi:dehydrogenase/reductase SDR family member 7B
LQLSLHQKANRVKGKTVIITGASSGIGKALAERYAQAGSRLVLAARSLDKLEEVAAGIRARGGEAICVATDVTRYDDCARMVAAAISAFGSVDVLVNNAGISMRAMLMEADVSVIEQVMAINFTGTLYCTKAALPALLQSKGVIIGVSSIAGYVGLPGRTGYSASKHAMHGFLDAMRVELLKTGVHVLVACPGFTSSNIRNTALGADGKAQKENPLDEQRLMPAEQVADIIYQAALRRRRTVTMTTQGRLLVFLHKWLPGMADKMIWKHYAKEPGLNLK